VAGDSSDSVDVIDTFANKLVGNIK
jgi:hypothetical protein